MLGKDIFTVAQRTCIGYACEDPKYLLIQPVDEHDVEVLDAEIDEISKQTEDAFLLIAFEIKDWNQELSPWRAPAVFGNENFGDGAKATLEFIERELRLRVIERYGLGEDIPLILGGYSLAGVFSLWSATQTKGFQAIMAASPSVWFEGWMDYVRMNPVKADAVYLSLGDKEEKIKNQTLAVVGDAIREQSELLHAQGSKCILEWNQGNHFRDSDKRCARGFVWCMKALEKREMER